MKNLTAAVVGCGRMGRHHVRILGTMPDVELLAVADSDLTLASPIAEAYGATAVATVAELPEVDLTVVAVPTPAHVETAVALIERGCAVLIEKPLAGDAASGQRVLDAAASAGVLVGVGHVERFNPAVAAMLRLVDDPLFMQFERLSPFTPRIGDSVVFDLMVHDLDLACAFAGVLPERVECAGVKVFSDTLDAASAVLQFPGGSVATLLASRITQDKVRRIVVSEKERLLSADCLRQDIQIKRETVSEYLDDEHGTYRQASVTEIPYLERHSEPLAAELRNFVAAVRGEEPVAVDGAAGLAAVELARRVEHAAGA